MWTKIRRDTNKGVIDIIAPYHKLFICGHEIKHPSQDFKDIIKNSDWDKLTEENDKLLKAFKEKVENAIRITKSYGKVAYLVFPPSKEGKDNQVISLIKFLKIQGEFKTIEFTSKNYSFKNKSKKERVRYMEDQHKMWVLNNAQRSIPKTEKPYFVFVDDIITTGITSKYIIKAIKSNYGLKEIPLHRSIYLMGTKSTDKYKENKVFDFPDIWDKK